MKFPTNIGRLIDKNRTRYRHHTGTGVEPEYKLMVSKDGVRDLQIVGEIDTYGKIQSYKDSVDINVILQRFANGDTSALSSKQGMYGDFTQVPRTLAELQQRVIDAEQLFYAQPLEVRAQFNHSPSQFFAAIGTDKFNAIFADKTPAMESPVDEHSTAAPASAGTEQATKGSDE